MLMKPVVSPISMKRFRSDLLEQRIAGCPFCLVRCENSQLIECRFVLAVRREVIDQREDLIRSGCQSVVSLLLR